MTDVLVLRNGDADSAARAASKQRCRAELSGTPTSVVEVMPGIVHGWSDTWRQLLDADQHPADS